jgi:hypothetical protein
MRLPARFGSVALLALAVIGAIGAAILLRRLGRRGQVVMTVCGFLIVLAEGWIVPMRIVSYNARGRPEDREAAQWLAGVQRVVPSICRWSLTTSKSCTISMARCRMDCREWDERLQQRLQRFSQSRRPLTGNARRGRMLRAIGFDTVVHPGDYTHDERRDQQEERSIELLRNSGQVSPSDSCTERASSNSHRGPSRFPGLPARRSIRISLP